MLYADAAIAALENASQNVSFELALACVGKIGLQKFERDGVLAVPDQFSAGIAGREVFRLNGVDDPELILGATGGDVYTPLAPAVCHRSNAAGRVYDDAY